MTTDKIKDQLIDFNRQFKKNSGHFKSFEIILDKVVLEGDYKAKNQIIENEIVLINKDLQELEIKKQSQDNITLEQIRNAFLEPKTMQKEFLSKKPDEQRNTLITLLWNATIDNKKSLIFLSKSHIMSSLKLKIKAILIQCGE